MSLRRFSKVCCFVLFFVLFGPNSSDSILLLDNRKTIMDDPFIRDYIEELLKNIRTQVLIKLIKPYTRIEVGFISKELNITPAEVESLLVSLILDNKVNGRIDQVNQRLELIAEYLPSFFFSFFLVFLFFICSISSSQRVRRVEEVHRNFQVEHSAGQPQPHRQQPSLLNTFPVHTFFLEERKKEKMTKRNFSFFCSFFPSSHGNH